MFFSEQDSHEVQLAALEKLAEKGIKRPSEILLHQITEKLPEGDSIDIAKLVRFLAPDAKDDKSLPAPTSEEQLTIRGLGAKDVDMTTLTTLCADYYKAVWAEKNLLGDLLREATYQLMQHGKIRSNTISPDTITFFQSAIIKLTTGLSFDFQDFVFKVQFELINAIAEKLGLSELRHSVEKRQMLEAAYQPLTENPSAASCKLERIAEAFTENGLDEGIAKKLVSADNLNTASQSLTREENNSLNTFTQSEKGQRLFDDLIAAYTALHAEKVFVNALIDSHIMLPKERNSPIAANRNSVPNQVFGDKSEAYLNLLEAYVASGICEGEHSARQEMKKLSDQILEAISPHKPEQTTARS